MEKNGATPSNVARTFEYNSLSRALPMAAKRRPIPHREHVFVPAIRDTKKTLSALFCEAEHD